MSALLVVVAVPAEADALAPALGGTDAEVLVAGVGPAAAAAATAARLAHRERPDIVLSAGVGGGFAPLGIGDIAIATRSVFADLGADSDDGFLPADTIGLGPTGFTVDAGLAAQLAARAGGHPGTVLTVATATGTTARRLELTERHPDAVAEAMEGAGVATAAGAHHRVHFAEVRAVSNRVGPRDRAAWEIPRALSALADAVGAIVARPLEIA